MGIVALIVGSAVGGVSRYFLGSAVHHATGTAFPLGTLVVNLVGCLVIGFLSAAGGTKFNLGHEAQLLLVTGFCGGFTTFSAFILESEALIRGGMVASAAAYLFSTLLLGFGAFLLGATIGRAI